MKKWITLVFLLRLAYGQPTEYQWFDPAAAVPAVIDGRGWNEGFASPYDRLPARAEPMVRNVLWGLSRHAAGQYIQFTTNSRSIVVRYGVKGAQSMPQMPATGVSGVDLYATDGADRWSWIKGTLKFGDTIVYRFENLPAAASNHRFRLYLPLYTAVQWMQVGVPKDIGFKAFPVGDEKPIVAYGTSIMHGAYASRPGLAWTNILGRKLNTRIVNLGFSGNGQLETALIDLINEVDARLYILDCMPNLWDRTKFPPEEIEARMRHSLSVLRKKHPEVPVVFAEHCSGSEGVNMDTVMTNRYVAVSRVAYEVFQKMRKDGVRNIYHLSAQQIGFDLESTVDGTHPNDIGMMQYAEAYTRLIARLLKM
jgi:hypothetical protein